MKNILERFLNFVVTTINNIGTLIVSIPEIIKYNYQGSIFDKAAKRRALHKNFDDVGSYIEIHYEKLKEFGADIMLVNSKDRSMYLPYHQWSKMTILPQTNFIEYKGETYVPFGIFSTFKVSVYNRHYLTNLQQLEKFALDNERERMRNAGTG